MNALITALLMCAGAVAVGLPVSIAVGGWRTRSFEWQMNTFLLCWCVLLPFVLMGWGWMEWGPPYPFD